VIFVAVLFSSIELIGLRYRCLFLREKQPGAGASMITTEHAIMKIAKTQVLQFGNNPESRYAHDGGDGGSQTRFRCAFGPLSRRAVARLRWGDALQIEDIKTHIARFVEVSFSKL
jgi:hypothetical protein